MFLETEEGVHSDRSDWGKAPFTFTSSSVSWGREQLQDWGDLEDYLRKPGYSIDTRCWVLSRVRDNLIYTLKGALYLLVENGLWGRGGREANQEAVMW